VINIFKKTTIVSAALLVLVFSAVSCSSNDFTEWMEQGDWAQSGPVCYCTPKGWANLPGAGNVWHEFMKANNGQGMLARIDPTESAELKILMLQPRAEGDNPEDSDFGAFTESAAEMFMADYSNLDFVSMVETEVSGYPAYEIDYYGSNEGSDVEGRFTTITSSNAIVIITYVAPAEEWDHFSSIYDRIKSNIYFTTDKDSEGNWEVCFPWLR
jgi:hypothetical protein